MISRSRFVVVENLHQSRPSVAVRLLPATPTHRVDTERQLEVPDKQQQLSGEL